MSKVRYYHKKSLQKVQNVGCRKNLATSLWPRTICTLLCLTAPLLFVIARPTLFSRIEEDVGVVVSAESLRGTLVL